MFPKALGLGKPSYLLQLCGSAISTHPDTNGTIFSPLNHPLPDQAIPLSKSKSSPWFGQLHPLNSLSYLPDVSTHDALLYISLGIREPLCYLVKLGSLWTGGQLFCLDRQLCPSWGEIRLAPSPRDSTSPWGLRPAWFPPWLYFPSGWDGAAHTAGADSPWSLELVVKPLCPLPNGLASRETWSSPWLLQEGRAGKEQHWIGLFM